MRIASHQVHIAERERERDANPNPNKNPEIVFLPQAGRRQRCQVWLHILQSMQQQTELLDAGIFNLR